MRMIRWAIQDLAKRFRPVSAAILRGILGSATNSMAALVLVTVLLVVLSAATPAGAGDVTPLPHPEPVQHRFVAEVDDATAVFLNPAGIGVLTGNNLFVSVAGISDDVDGFSVGLQGGVLAVGYRHRDLQFPAPGVSPVASSSRGAFTEPLASFLMLGPVEGNIDSYHLAAGVGPQWLRVGASFARVTSDLPGDDASCWRAGLRSRPHPAVSVGATVDHIDRPSFLSGELCTAYTYGVALHPIPGRPEWLTLNVEGTHLDGDSEIDLAYSARLLTRQGLELALLVRDDNGEDPQVGFRMTGHFGRGSAEVGFRSVGTRGSDLRWHAGGHLYDDDWRRARAPREGAGE